MIHLHNNIPFEPRRALQWCHNQNVAQWSGWQLKTNKQKVSKKLFPLKITLCCHTTKPTSNRIICALTFAVDPNADVLFLSFNWHSLTHLTWSSCLWDEPPYLPIWTLLGKAPIVSPQTQENSSKSWLQEILILLVQICERHWGWRQLGKGQKGETLLEIHSCRIFSPAVARTLVRLRPAVDGPHARWGECDSGGQCLHIHTHSSHMRLLYTITHTHSFSRGFVCSFSFRDIPRQHRRLLALSRAKAQL